MNKKCKGFNAVHYPAHIWKEGGVYYMQFLDLWQIREMKNGLAEAAAGQMVTHENIVKHWKKKRAHVLRKASSYNLYN